MANDNEKNGRFCPKCNNYIKKVNLGIEGEIYSCPCGFEEWVK